MTLMGKKPMNKNTSQCITIHAKPHEVEAIDVGVGDASRFLVRLLAIMPESVSRHFHRNNVYFAEGPDQLIYIVPREGTKAEVVRDIAEKINAYLLGQPKEFIGLELDTEH